MQGLGPIDGLANVEEAADSAWIVAQSYETGYGGLEQSYELARRYYELAVRGGIPEASEALGHLDFHGLGMPPKATSRSSEQEHDDGDLGAESGEGEGGGNEPGDGAGAKAGGGKTPPAARGRASAGRAYPFGGEEEEEPRPDMASAKRR